MQRLNDSRNSRALRGPLPDEIALRRVRVNEIEFLPLAEPLDHAQRLEIGQRIDGARERKFGPRNAVFCVDQRRELAWIRAGGPKRGPWDREALMAEFRVSQWRWSPKGLGDLLSRMLCLRDAWAFSQACSEDCAEGKCQ